jgi:hypothetical protein
VGSKVAVWEVKDPLLSAGAGTDYPEDDASNYQGGASLVGGYNGQQMYGGRAYPPHERY